MPPKPQGNIYTAKRKPVRLECEVCGVTKGCVPCANHRWCQKGRCPLCFPTVLHLDDSREVQLKIWDMAFYCETCSKKEVDPKTNKKKLQKLHENLQSAFEGGKAAVRLEGCPDFWITRDGRVLTQEQHAALGQPQQQLQQPPQQQLKAPAAAQQQPHTPTKQKQTAAPSQRPASAAAGQPAPTPPQQKQKPGAPRQQQQQQSKAATPKSAAAAQPQQQQKATPAAQGQQLKAAPAQQAQRPAPPPQQQKQQQNQQQNPAAKPKQGPAQPQQQQPRPAAPAQQQEQPRPAGQQQQQQQQKPAAGAAAAGGGPQREKRLAEGGEPVKKRLKTTAAATEAAASVPSRPPPAQQQQQQQQKRPKAAAAAAAAAGADEYELADDSEEGLGQLGGVPQDESSEEEQPESSSGDDAEEQPAAAAAKKPATAPPGKQQQKPPDKQQAAATARGDPVGSKPAPAAAKVAPAATPGPAASKPSEAAAATAGGPAASKAGTSKPGSAAKAAAAPSPAASKPGEAPAAAPTPGSGAGKPGASKSGEAPAAAARLGQQQQLASKQRSSETPGNSAGVDAGAAGKKPPTATVAKPPSAAAAAAGPPGAAAAGRNAVRTAGAKRSRSPSPLAKTASAAAAAAAGARGLKRHTPDSGDGGESSDGLPVADLRAQMRAQAGAGGSQTSRLKPKVSDQQQQQQQREGLSSKPSSGAAAAAATADKPKAKQVTQQPSLPQQQQQAPRAPPAAPPKAAAAALGGPKAAAAGETSGKPETSRKQQQDRTAAVAGTTAATTPAAPAAAGTSSKPEEVSRKQQQDRGLAAPPAAPKAAAAGAPGKPEVGKKMQQDRGPAAAAAAAAGKGFKAAAAARGKAAPSPPSSSDDDEDEGGSGEEPMPMDQGDISSGDIDEDQVEKIFGDDEAQKALEPKAAAADGEQKQAQRRQQQGRKPGAAAAAAAAGKAGTNGLPAARGAAGAAAAGRGAAGAAAAATGASKVKQKPFDALSLYGSFQAGLNADFPSSPTAAGAAVAAVKAAAKEREAAALPGSSLWPIKCKAQVIGPSFAYEFNVRIKEGPDRSNVQVPRMLEHDGRLSCGFQQRHGMLQSVAIDAGTGAQFEVVPDEPVPMVLSEVAHEPQLPAVIRHMIEKKEYLRAEARGRVLFFAPVLRENGHAVDYSRLSGTAAEYANLHPRVSSSELGLVMFKDLQESSIPEQYGKLNKSEPNTPTAPREVKLYDESFLYDTNLDHFYDDIIIQNVMAQGAHLRIAMAMNGSLQQDMNMNMDEGHMDIDGQPQQQQQRRRVQFAAQSDLGAGMGRELLGRPSDPRLSRMPARPPAPEGGWGSGAYQPAYSVSPGSHGATPHSETGSGSDLRQQDSWQQPQEQDGMQGDTPRSGPSPATDAAAAAAAGHPVFEQQQPLPGPAPEGLSPLQVVLAGYKPQWPLLPSDEQVLELLRTQGLTGLTVYLDEGAFADLTVPGKSHLTEDYVKRARRHGVTVYAPDQPQPLPPPGSVHVVVVSRPHMERCGLDVPQSKAHIAEYLASGALVLQEGFNLEVSNLPTESLNDLCIALENRALAGSLSKPLFSTGVVLLLDVSLLLATPAASIHALLEQLHSLKQLMSAGAVVKAYAQQNHLEEAAAQHLGGAHMWNKYRQMLSGRGASELCGVLDPKMTSNNLKPEGTHVLRSARKVAFNYNKPQQCEREHTAPLRFTVVVTADPDAPQLTDEQRQSVRELLDNDDGEHKTVIGATLTQTHHLLAALKAELTGQ